MAEQHENLLWVADDGSYGTGRILLVDTLKWTPSQWAVFTEITDSSYPTIDEVLAIDSNDYVGKVSETQSDSTVVMLLSKNPVGDIVAKFYQRNVEVMGKRLTDTETYNLQDFIDDNALNGDDVTVAIPLDKVLDTRTRLENNGAWMNDDEGNPTNLDLMLNELRDLQNKDTK
jgi:hypothetical protein